MSYTNATQKDLNVPQKPVAVIGTGSWGTALAILIARNGYCVRLWGCEPNEIKDLKENRRNSRYLGDIQLPEKITIDDDLSSILNNCNDIIIAVPSHAFQSLLQLIHPLIQNKDKIRFAWGTKGLDTEHKLLHETASEIIGKRPMAIISGPSFAKEVAEGLPTAVTVAATDNQFAEDLANYLHNETFRVYLSNDLIGIEICGAVKNVLAIAIGIAAGMGLGANSRAALMTRGLAELTRLGLALGGKQETFMGLAGIGDLILTCTDDQSRNRRFGLAIGKGTLAKEAEQSIGQIVEGIANTKEVYLLAKSKNVEMPIVEQVYKILYENLSPKDALKTLLSRSRKESEF